MNPSKNKNRERLLALPYIHLRDGVPTARVPYSDSEGKKRFKEKRLPDNATVEDAINLIASIKQEVGANPARLDGAKMTFDVLLAQYKRAHKLPDWYETPLRFFDGRKIATITYADCLRFKEVRQQVTRMIPDPENRKQKLEVPRKPATVHRELEILRGVLLFAVRHGWLDRNPMSAGRPLIEKAAEERRDRLPTPEEESRLLAVCVPPREHLRGLIIATRDTGLRRSALQALEWSMVDWEQRLLKVPIGNRYKRRPRVIGLTHRLWFEFRALWESRDRPAAGAIFNAAKNFKRSFATACRLAGVTGLRFNDLRHGFATDLMEAGVNERLAMKIAGHSNSETHAIYTNVDERLALQVTDALNALHRMRNQSLS